MPVDHYENFPVASILLPKKLRQPIKAIYRFARSADDLADEGEASNEQRLQALDAYRQELDRIEQGIATEIPLFQALGAVIQEWRLPLAPFRDLLDAFAQDVVQTRYTDYPELLEYCRRSANPVGCLMLHLSDRANAENLYRSDCICTALQLINFWQDIAIDWQKHRVYLPQTDLERFKVSENHIAKGLWNANWAELLDFEIDRAYDLMIEGLPLIHQLPGRMGWEIRLTIQGGLRILEHLRKVRGDVFRHRPQLGIADWATMAARSLFM